MSNKKLLNIGCGETFHPDWENLDVNPSAPSVRAHNARHGLPYPNDIFDACYCSHVLEHLSRNEVRKFVGENFRVLKPGGIARFVVPDLESIVRHYLQALNDVSSGDRAREDDYDWIMLELYDQTVRYVSGGEMGCYLSNPNITNKSFVISRIGMEAQRYLEGNAVHARTPLREKIKPMNGARFIRKLRTKIATIMVWIIAGAENRQSFREGIFRNSGEIHRWMYDRFSLQRLMQQAGFIDIATCRADESRIAEFNKYELDVVGGHIRKPDSLFMEGAKP